MELRPYQVEAVKAVETAFENVDSTLISLATGCGKTIVFSNIAKDEVNHGGRVLILAHRGELLEQAIDKLKKATGIVAGLEKAENHARADIDEMPYTVIVGSVQSMCKPKRLEQYARDDFSLVIIDECHHALTGTYRSVIDYFNSAKLLGVTATPDRGDMRSLGEVFQSISYEYSIVQAIKDGYLTPIVAQTIPLQIDLTAVQKQGGDYQASGVGTALDPYLEQIAQEIKDRCADRKTIVFTPLIATSKKLLEILKSKGVTNVREVNGESQDRKETLEWFSKAPKGCVCLNSMLLTEGYDEPSCDCIVVLRATKVRALFTQMVGRGTRLCDGKRNLLLLDFLWLTATHDLCRPSCILSADEDVQEVITRKMESNAGSAEIELSPDELEEAQEETIKKREESVAKKLEKMRRRKGGLVDPLQYAYSIKDVDLTDYKPITAHDAEMPTMQQIERLEKMGLGCPESFGGAEKLIKAFESREGLATPRQIRQLERRGFKNVGSWTLQQANKMMSRIASNGWITPYSIHPETYIPQ